MKSAPPGGGEPPGGAHPRPVSLARYTPLAAFSPASLPNVSAMARLMLSLFVLRDRGRADGEPVGPTDAADVAAGEGARDKGWLAVRCTEVAAASGLTPRERDILGLLAQGRTVHDASELLGVSENTVKSHAKSVYQKLAVHTRSELIALVRGDAGGGAAAGACHRSDSGV